jgi:hypothetical protein
MYLIGHAAVGMTLAASMTNPVAAFGVGWLSHYFADFFPHGDEEVGEWTKKGNEVRRLMAIVAVDGAVFLAAFAFMTARNGFSLPLAAAAAGSFVPDVMWGLEKVAKRKLFGPHEKIHYANHNFFEIPLPAWAGVPLQLAVAALLWWQLTAR